MVEDREYVGICFSFYFYCYKGRKLLEMNYVDLILMIVYRFNYFLKFLI